MGKRKKKIAIHAVEAQRQQFSVFDNIFVLLHGNQY